MNTSPVQKQEKCLKLHLKHFVPGVKMVRSVLLNCHPDKEDIISKTSTLILASLLLLRKKGRFVTVECVPKKQMDDLERQKDFFRREYPDYELVTDVGSGLNWKRKGLKTILEQSMLGNIERVVVAHRDRLCRFAFELIEFIFESNNVKLLVLDTEAGESGNDELTSDILSIIHVYSCRSMGKRRYTSQKNKNISKQETNSEDEELDGNNEVCIQQNS
jgi:predicted site-specific integrase-resolvase